MKRVLLLAADPVAWGELTLGVRLGAELAARGHQVTIAAPETLRAALSGSPVPWVPIPVEVPRYDALLRQLVDTHRPHALVLVDARLVYMALDLFEIPAEILDSLGPKVIGLDVWDLPSTDMETDFGDHRWDNNPHVRTLPRLRPVPFLRPGRTPGLYNALPDYSPISRAARREARVVLGLGARDRMILFPTSVFQLAGRQFLPSARRLARLVPNLVAPMLARLGSSVRLFHVSPRPWPMLRRALGGRYVHETQLPPHEYAAIQRAADLVLGFNLSSTSLGGAIALGLPILVGTNSWHVPQGADAPYPLESRAAAALRAAAPIFPFRVWPLGFHDLMSPTLRRNPYLKALRTAEVLDAEGFVSGMNDLLFHATARADLAGEQDAYRRRVRRLGSGADWMERFLTGGG
jgi:hypothetical protein